MVEGGFYTSGPEGGSGGEDLKALQKFYGILLNAIGEMLKTIYSAENPYTQTVGGEIFSMITPERKNAFSSLLGMRPKILDDIKDEREAGTVQIPFSSEGRPEIVPVEIPYGIIIKALFTPRNPDNSSFNEFMERLKEEIKNYIKIEYFKIINIENEKSSEESERHKFVIDAIINNIMEYLKNVKLIDVLPVIRSALIAFENKLREMRSQELPT